MSGDSFGLDLDCARILGAKGDGVSDDSAAYALLADMRYEVKADGAQWVCRVTHLPSAFSRVARADTVLQARATALRRLGHALLAWNAGVPDWVARKYSTAERWQRVGERRWRAWISGQFFGVDLLVMINVAGTRAVFRLINLDQEERFDNVAEIFFDRMQADLDHEDLPTCEAPGCTDKAPSVVVAAEPGSLAGVMRKPGDKIRFCPKHGYDVRRAGIGLDHIPEWLRPDAAVMDDHS